ncbi:MAG: TerB family tellurite resistance protein [Nitrospirota bacterium]|nr:TerB family tellurite resistance protein [Nitrospirota bacterium]MDH5586918.1 TerB family tellurite resistance protein [Nitrospirota bacterium]MDH5774939.1 TerB family tellurite resistance protein [Nitrospirota bacterium]
MADKRFILELGKLLIAAAWADGTLSTKEINGLKELLFQLPDISGEEWMELELYMASPVGEAERQRLLDRVMAGMGSASDKALALETLGKLVPPEASESDQQREVVQQLREDLEQGRGGFWDHLRRPFRRMLNLRGEHYRDEQDRESRLEDFIKNTIYFQVTMALRDRGMTFDLPDGEVRKLCLAAGLMARVAGVDHVVSSEETTVMGQVLQRHWALTEDQAQLVAEISHHRIFRGLDSVRLVKRFKELTTRKERNEFLHGLFEVANAADQTSFEEIEEIRGIAQGMDLSHQDFLDAKLAIPREDRKGL